MIINHRMVMVKLIDQLDSQIQRLSHQTFHFLFTCVASHSHTAFDHISRLDAHAFQVHLAGFQPEGNANKHRLFNNHLSDLTVSTLHSAILQHTHDDLDYD